MAEKKNTERLLFDASPVGIALCKTNNVFVDANKAFLRITGQTLANLKKLFFKDILSPDSTLPNDIQRQQETAENNPLEVTLIHKNGNPVPVFLRVSSVQLNDGQILMYTVEDISLYTMRANDYEIKSDFVETLINTIPDLVWLKDTNGVYLKCNRAFERLYGVEEGASGKTDYDFIDKEQADFFRLHDRKVIQNKQSTTIEEYLKFKDKSYEGWFETIKIPMLNKSGKIIGVLGIARNITERMKVNEQLQISEEKFRKAFLTSPDSVNINRLKDGLYVNINRGFTQIMGYTEEDVIGKTSTELNIWKNTEDRKRLVTGLNEKGMVKNLEAEFLTKDGEVKYGLMLASLIQINDEPHILNITRDITDRKKAEEELKKYREDLEEVVKQRTQELEKKNETLERMNKLFVGRELRIKELKVEVDALYEELKHRKH